MAQCRLGPHGPSSFTVTVLGRKRSKQTCGGRECLTWWIAVISFRRPIRRDLLLTDSPSDRATRCTKWDLWPEAQSETWGEPDPSKTTIQRSLCRGYAESHCFWSGEIFPTWKLGVWWAPRPLLTGTQPCQQGWWGCKFQAMVSAPFCTLFTSCVTSCFFILEEEHRKARYSPLNPNLLFAQTKSHIVAHFPVSFAAYFQPGVWYWHSSRSNLCMPLIP